MTISKQIEEKIESMPMGSVFVVSDFTDLTNYDTARKTLSRLDEAGKITKVIRGVYYKQKYSKLLKENVAVNINLVSQAIARSNEWSITPSGENALNLLGISSQVPARYCYISSGPYRTYLVNGIQIEFNHRNDKELNGKSYITRLTIQAIKAIGKDRIKDYVQIFKSHINNEDKKTILKESQRTTAWVYDVIKMISKED